MGSLKRELHQGLTTAVAIGSVLRVARRADAASALTKAETDQILADAVAGKAVAVVFDAITYVQRPTPNRNFVRFSPGGLKSLAPSFAGAPFLRNHDRNDVMSRGGTILESKLVDHEGNPAIWMRVELTAPWAVELALRSLMDRFSIGWFPTGIYQCSVDGKNMLDWRGKDPCLHWPGDVVEVEGEKVTVEAVLTGAEGTETSTVVVPAVVGTEVQEIRAAFEAARSADARPHKDSHMNELKSKIAHLLSLSVDAADEAVLGAIGALRTEANAQREAASRLQVENERLTTAAASAAAAQLDADIVMLMNDATKKLGQQLDATGQRVEGELELALRTTAKTVGIKAARELLARLPQVVPATIASTDPRRVDPTPRAVEGKATVATLTAQQLKYAAQMGVTPEAYAEQINKRSGR